MQIRRLLAVLGCSALVAGGLALSIPTAYATTFTVNTGGDGAGVCPATCTLRAAITAANANAGPDIVQFSINGTITLASGELVVNDASGGALTIAGNGTGNTIINAATLSRAINVTGPNALTLQNLTIENGNVTGNGGGVQSGSSVTTANANFTSNVASASGGAISAPTVTVVGGTFDHNSGFASGAIDTGTGNISGNAKFTRNNATSNRFGAVGFGTSLVVDNSTFGGIPSSQGNTASVAGGAIGTIGGTSLTVTRSIFINNSALSGGGAIYTTASTNVSVSTSAFLSNITNGGQGGGIFMDQVGGGPFTQVLTVTQSVFQDNRNTAGSGGAIGFTVASSTSSINATITNNTFDVNKATTTGAGINVTNANAGTATVTLRNNTFSGGTVPAGSVVANNGGTVTLIANILDGNGAGTSCAGTMTDGGNNLIFNDFGASTCPTIGTNISGEDPLLGPLQTNSPGFTATRALLPGSPAIDAVQAGCPPPSTDQRGVARPQGLRCDIGAYEFQVAVPVTGQPSLTG